MSVKIHWLDDENGLQMALMSRRARIPKLCAYGRDAVQSFDWPARSDLLHSSIELSQLAVTQYCIIDELADMCLIANRR